MAFVGPDPFSGDPVFNYLDAIEGRSPREIREAMESGFAEAESLGAFDVDACVWAWACAEMLALALGRPSSTPPPSPFNSAKSIPDPASLVPKALATLKIIADPKTSELAGLMGELASVQPETVPLDKTLAELEARLRPPRS